MSSENTKRTSVGELADEFLQRYRRGERPALSEYFERYPEYADEIRDVFPGLAMIEDLGPELPDGSAQPADVAPEFATEQLGDYRIIREVGRGGMGVVYEAEQVSLGRRVALKVLPRQLWQDDRHARRFEREARAAARLHHTNIVPVFGVGEQDGLHYYVMQFIQGLSLDDVLDELKKLREASEAGRVEGPEFKVQGGDGDVGGAAELPGEAARDVSALGVAQSLLSGRFERTIVLEKSQTDQPTAVSDPVSSLNPQPSTLNPPDTAVGRLSDTHVSASSFALPGQSEAVSRTQSRKIYWQSVARIGVQAAEALDYAHDQRIVHRDVKPSNLLLDTRGTIWITDFGLAKAADQQDLTHTGDVLGTLRYMAPEQFEGQADARSDVYSLGLTLYELLALEPAFNETDRYRLVKQVTHGTPVRLRTLDPTIPRDLETIVHKAIDRDADHRYQSARELAEDLQRYLGDEPIQARRISPVARVRRWCRRNPGLSALTGLATALMLSTSIASGMAAVRNREASESSAALVTTEREARQRIQRAMDELGEAKDAVDRLAEESRQRLVRLYVRSGTEHVDQGDYTLALPWFVRALEVDADDPGRATIHRLRIATTLDRCAKLTAVGFPDHPVDTMQFYPDGERILVTGGDRTSVWDISTGRRNQPRLNGYFGRLSPDGRQIVLLNHTGKVSLLDADTGAVQLELPAEHARPDFAGFSDDGTLLFVAYGATAIRVWSTATGEPQTPLLSESAGQLEAARISPDNRYLVCLVDQQHWPELATVWDLQSLEEFNHITIGGPFTLPGKRWLDELVCTADAFAVQDDVFVSVFGLQDGRRKYQSLHHADGVVALVLSPDRSMLLSCSWDNTARLWDVRTGEPIGEPLPHNSRVTVAEFSPDGSRCVTGTTSGEVSVWRIAEQQREFPTLRHAGSIRAVQFSPDGRLLVVASDDGSLRTWDLAASVDAPELMRRHPGFGLVPQFSADGNQIAIGALDGTARIYDVPTGRLTAPPLRDFLHESVAMVNWSPDESQMLTAIGEGTIRLWDLPSGELVFENSDLRLRPADARHLPSYLVNSYGLPFVKQRIHCGFIPDRRRFFAWVTQGRPWQAARAKVALFDTDTGELTAGPVIIDPDIADAAIAPKRGEWVIAARDGIRLKDSHIEVRSLETLELLRTFPLKLAPQEIQLSDDERTLLVGLAGRGMNSTDGQVVLLDLETGEALIPPIDHQSRIQHVRLLSDGTILSITDQDGQIRSWDGTTGLPTAPGIRVGSRVSVIEVHPGELWCAAGTGTNNTHGGREESLQLWDLRTGEPISPPAEHALTIMALAISPDGRRLASSSREGHLRIWTVPRERRPAAELERLVELVTGLRLDETDTLVPIDAARFRELWTDLGASYPHEFTTTAAEEKAWVRREIGWPRGTRWPQDGQDTATRLERLDRLIVLDPHDPGLYRWRMQLHGQQGTWAEIPQDVEMVTRLDSLRGKALADLASEIMTTQQGPEAAAHNAYALELAGKAIEQAPEDGRVWFTRADMHLQLGHRDKGEADLLNCVKLLPQHYRPWYELALLELGRGDIAAYRSTCQEMLDAVALSYQGLVDESVAWTCCLHPDSVEDFSPVIERARVTVQMDPVDVQSRGTLGAALYRDGHMDGALEHLTEADRTMNDPSSSMASSPAYTWYFLALTHHRLGNGEEALTWLNKANGWTDRILADADNPPAWNRRLTLELLRAEAETLLGIDAAP